MQILNANLHDKANVTFKADTNRLPHTMIELSQITKKYGSQTILNKLSLNISSGDTHILLGSSGCGKSTILRLIIRLEHADSGDISVNRLNIHNITNRELSKYFGYVIQDKTLMPHLNALDNILLPVKARKISIDSVKEHLEYLKDLTQLDQNLIEKYPSQLSGGQKQRVCLMRALILNPPYLLMDEPFSALDPMIRSNLQNEMKMIFLKLKRTVIFVTHDLNEAALLGDKVSLLNQGQIVQEGKIHEMKQKPSSEFVDSFFKAQTQYF